MEDERTTLQQFFGCNQCTHESHKRYQPLKIIGKGSYGIVCSAIDMCSKPGQSSFVAIKRISSMFDCIPDTLRILREIVFLRGFGNAHPDIVHVRDILMPSNVLGYQSVYIVFDLMDMSLKKIINDYHTQLTTSYIKTFMYQLLKAIAFLHHVGILHRDLKPENILVSTQIGPSLKLCDFGLARSYANLRNHQASIGSRRSKRNESLRGRERVASMCSYLMQGESKKPPLPIPKHLIEPQPHIHMWTDYVATRWYRAPELCGSFFGSYTAAVDMWSIGCIFGEMLLGYPVLMGSSTKNQLKQIIELLHPSPTEIERITNTKAQQYVQAVSYSVVQPQFEEVFGFVNCPDTLDLLRRMLAFSPENRITAEEALRHPYFRQQQQQQHDDEDLNKVAESMRGALERLESLDKREANIEEHVLRKIIFDEINAWRLSTTSLLM